MNAVQLYKPSLIFALADEIDASFGYKRQQAAVETSLAWLDECLDIRKPATLVFGVLVGGNEMRLRERSAVETCRRAIDGVVISGFGSCETTAFRDSILSLMDSSWVPRSLPRIVLNIGLPLDVLAAVAKGVDGFYSSYPLVVTKCAYALTFWISDSTVRMKKRNIESHSKQFKKRSYECVCAFDTKNIREHIFHGTTCTFHSGLCVCCA
jgi:queuine tRNA-ribosyltransferase subunit QTRTD1